jgi:hypothetical protein
MLITRQDAEQFPGLLHYQFDAAYCLPKSPTGQYYQVERWSASAPYMATFDNRESATRFAELVSKTDRYDARIIKLNA